MATKKRKRRLTRAQRARRARRRRMILRVIGYAVIGALVLAFGVLGAWLMISHEPEHKAPKCIVEYQDFIRRYAGENGIEPAYVASVIMAESSYRPDVVSNVGAQGLMQIMPETGDWIAGKFDEEYANVSMFDPETNIRYGCWYLGYLMNRFDGSMRCATAAFHAGQGTVDKWLDDPMYSADGETLDVIPSEATGTYVERIMEYYEVYEEIYG